MHDIEVPTSKQLDDIWEAKKDHRHSMVVRQLYYAGHHSIVNRKEKYSDGFFKSNVVTNWIKYLVNRYVGSIS